MARKVLKAAFGLVAGLLTLVACIYVLMLCINFNDKIPSKGAIHLQNIIRARPTVPDEENAYVYLMGFSIVKDEDPGEWGKKRIAFARQILQQPDAEMVSDLPGEEYDPRKDRMTSVKTLLEACHIVTRACLSALEVDDQRLGDWLAQEGWLLARYKALLAHSAWAETMPFDVRMLLPSYSDVFDAQHLLFVEAWRAAGRNDAAGVRTLLEKDVRFWRQVMVSSDILISKMIAAAALRRHFSWSNIILRRLPAGTVENAIPSLWGVPISKDERSMLRCFAGELEYSYTFTKQLLDGNANPLVATKTGSLVGVLSWRLFRPMFLPQDVNNRYAELLVSLDEALNVPYNQYQQATARAHAIESDSTRITFPGIIYNPVGDLLLSIGSGNLTSYAIRSSDVEGLRRLALLAAEFRSRAIPFEEVPSKLLDTDIRHPYTDKPFSWDQESQAIVFTGLESGERGRHLMLY